VRFSVLVNGTPTGFFSSFPGLRQGDLLSLFLFVIFMEVLSKMIYALGNVGLLSGFMVGPRSGDTVTVSHLLFANNTLIFSGTNPYHLCNLRCLFLCFEAVSGLRINLAKSELVPVSNVINVEGLTSILVVFSLPMK
jgi:hypothetical protein